LYDNAGKESETDGIPKENMVGWN